jgi:preprotein translocase subunit SecD
MTCTRFLAATLAALVLPLTGCGADDPPASDADRAPLELRKVVTSSHLDGACRADAATCEAWARFTCPGEAVELDDDLLMACGTSDDAERSFLLGAPEITGGVAEAEATHRNGTAQWVVELHLDEDAARAFAALTTELVSTYAPIGIVLDGVVLAAPAVQERVGDGVVRLAGDYTEDEAEELAEKLSP